MSYRGQPKGSYGCNSKHGGFSWHKPKKAKPKENITDIKDEPQEPQDNSKPETPEPQVSPISWENRPLAPDVRIFCCRPTTLTVNSAKVILPSDLTQQKETAYQIALLAESQKLSLEALLGDGSIKKYRIIKIVDQLRTDKPLSFSDYPLIGNLKNGLGPHGYTILPQ